MKYVLLLLALCGCAHQPITAKDFMPQNKWVYDTETGMYLRVLGVKP